MSDHLRKQSEDSTTNAINLDSVFWAASQGWAASEVWGILKLDQKQPDQDIHMRVQCMKGRTCTDGKEFNLEESDGDYSFLLIGFANESDMTPKERRRFADKALKLISGRGRVWTFKEIKNELGWAERHAYRLLKGLCAEDKISRDVLGSKGGRLTYAYSKRDF